MLTKIEQLEALASHLLDGYRGLGARYALLSPMLFDADVAKRHGSGLQSRGFALVRDSLFLGCVQEIAKYSLDDYRRSPSMMNIMRLLKEPVVREELRARYAAWSAPLMEPEADPDVLELMRIWEVAEVLKRGAEFDSQWQEQRTLWPAFSTSPTMKKLATIRNKLTAHTELQLVVDQYALIDIAALGIKWNDIKAVMAEMRQAVLLINSMVRIADFAWDVFDKQNASMSSGFWSAPA